MWIQNEIRESIEFLLEGNIDYEFRMTVVPFLHREDDVYEVASFVQKAKKFFIQEFRPDCTLSLAYAHIRPFPPDKMEKIRANVTGIMTADDQARETQNSNLG